MICAWKEFLAILPEWMRGQVDRQGCTALQELRLRLDKPPELILGGRSNSLDRNITVEDLKFCINSASRYSPWAAESVSSGYLTCSGGHRIGICGEVIMNGGVIQGIRNVSSLCIRVARDFSGIAAPLAAERGSVLILGSPGCGKTTLLRDLIRQISNRGLESVAVVDERGELFPSINGRPCFDGGKHTDIISGCFKAQGVDMVLRAMGPSVIAVDEITAEADCDALIRAGWCGVRLLATAHAADAADLRLRPIYRRLCECGLFSIAVVLRKDKTWTLERMVT